MFSNTFQGDYLLEAREQTWLDSLDEPESIPVPKDHEAEFEALWESVPVTLCIAAACQEKDEARILTCTDWKAESPLGVTQTADKFYRIKTPKTVWIALVAGKSSRGLEMVNLIRQGFLLEEVKYTNVLRLIRTAVGSHARRLREEYCLLKFGMAYAELRDWCRTLPADVVRSSIAEIKGIKLGASVLVAGFVWDTDQAPTPLICRVSQQTEEVVTESHFGAIGDGRTVAVPSLYRRSYDSDVPLGKAIYQVYEAKRLAEIIGSVGTDTSVDILYPDGHIMSLSDDGYAYYDELLKKFGPRARITNVRLTRDHIEPFENGVDETSVKVTTETDSQRSDPSTTVKPSASQK